MDKFIENQFLVSKRVWLCHWTLLKFVIHNILPEWGVTLDSCNSILILTTTVKVIFNPFIKIRRLIITRKNIRKKQNNLPNCTKIVKKQLTNNTWLVYVAIVSNTDFKRALTVIKCGEGQQVYIIVLNCFLNALLRFTRCISNYDTLLLYLIKFAYNAD